MWSPSNTKKMSEYADEQKIFVGDLLPRVRKNDLEKVFSRFGTIKCIWLARNPPGFAFVAFSDPRDAADAVRDRDGRTVCGQRARVKHYSERLVGVERRRTEMNRMRGSSSCYDCGEKGHLARECRSRRQRIVHRSRSRSNQRQYYRGRSKHSSYSRSSQSPRPVRRSSERIQRRVRSPSHQDVRNSQRISDPRLAARHQQQQQRNPRRSRSRHSPSYTPDGPRTPIDSPYRKSSRNRDSTNRRQSRDSVLELSIGSPKSRLVITKRSRDLSESPPPPSSSRRRDRSRTPRRRSRSRSPASKFRPRSPNVPLESSTAVKYRSLSTRDRGGGGDGRSIRCESRSSTYSRSRSNSLSRRGQKH